MSQHVEDHSNRNACGIAERRWGNQVSRRVISESVMREDSGGGMLVGEFVLIRFPRISRLRSAFVQNASFIERFRRNVTARDGMRTE